MLRLTVKGLLAHRRRLVGTFLAVFLGVAFLSGTLVLGDTFRASFKRLFTNANAGTDVIVRHASKLSVDPGEPASQRGVIDASLAASLRGVNGVAVVAPYVEGYGQLLGKNGHKVGGNGPPTLAGNWIGDAGLNPYRLVAGRAPQTDDEVVINRGAADSGHLRLGDTTIVETPDPVRVRVVGISTFGSSAGLGRVTFTAFTLPAAQQHLLGRTDQVVSVSLKARPGVSQGELLRRVQSVLPRDTEAITGTQRTSENTDEINKTFLDLFTGFLTVFAAIALVVATFSIYNTFAILVAQRTREAALLRAIGASKRQVLMSVVAEALFVGIIASVAGVLGGLGIAGLLKAMLNAFGFSLPAGGLVLHPSVIGISVAVGTMVTLLASVAPAVAASRVPPLAAIRDVDAGRPGASRRRAEAGLSLTGIGVVVILVAVLGGGTSLGLAGLGALVTILGVVTFGPVVAGPATAIIGAPARRLRGITGVLGRQNAMRNPRRTAATAAALMVGVGVVTLFTIFASSLKTAINDSVARSFRGDLVVSSGLYGGGGLSPQLSRDVRRLAEVDSATGLGRGRALVGTDTKAVSVADPARLTDVLDLDIRHGSVAALGPQQLAISQRVADDKGWTLGTPVPVMFPDGTTSPFTVGAIYRARDIAGNYIIPRPTWTAHAVQNLDTIVLIKLARGVPLERGRLAIEQAVRQYGSPDVQDRGQYTASLSRFVDTMLGIVYVLLALAIVIALMGIANTLSLSVYERTRELGLLRAIGETRSQLRSMIRWESAIIAAFGTVGGLLVGLFLGWALVQAASRGTADLVAPSFSAPVGRLVVLLVIGALAGVLAAVRPARRAARLPVLEAVSTA